MEIGDIKKRIPFPRGREVRIDTDYDFLGNTTTLTIVSEWPWFMTPQQLIANVVLGDDCLDGITPSKHIVSDPATITFWTDGTKTVSKAREGDEYDPVFGVMANAVRKLTRNRGHAVDEFEPALKQVSAATVTREDLEDLIEYGEVLLDAMRIAHDADELWEEQDEKPEAKPKAKPEPKSDDEPEVPMTQDMMRQVIRNLILDGEL